MAHTWQLRLNNQLAALSDFNAQLQDCIRQENVDAASAAALHLILDELLTNVIKYAHPHDEAAQAGARGIDVRLMLDAGQGADITIEDDGIPFDPTADQSHAAQAHADLPLEDRPVGGWGLRLVREMTDCFEYHRRDAHNVLRFTRKIPAPPAPPAAEAACS